MGSEIEKAGEQRIGRQEALERATRFIQARTRGHDVGGFDLGDEFLQNLLAIEQPGFLVLIPATAGRFEAIVQRVGIAADDISGIAAGFAPVSDLQTKAREPIRRVGQFAINVNGRVQILGGRLGKTIRKVHDDDLLTIDRNKC